MLRLILNNKKKRKVGLANHGPQLRESGDGYKQKIPNH